MEAEYSNSSTSEAASAAAASPSRGCFAVAVRKPAGSAMAPAPMNLSHISLLSLCRLVIVANLERYPAEAFCILGEDDFESIIQVRHEKTQPHNKSNTQAGGGGLDGTGRVAPAVSDRFLAECEEKNPHLAESEIVDHLVWKDCVEYRFRRGGLTRPRALLLPWPLLVEKIANAANALVVVSEEQESFSLESAHTQECIQTLMQAPMNVALLKATGAGKTIKKALKVHSNKDTETTESTTTTTDNFVKLEQLLEAWKALAAQSGVEMGTSSEPPKKKNSASTTTTTALASSSASASPSSLLAAAFQDDDEDLQLCESSCRNWRRLFCSLKAREDERRSSQGKRMREIRRNLASDRPKVVKVRPTPAKHSFILNRPLEKKKSSATTTSSSSQSPAGNRMLQLRKESSVVSARQRSDPAQPKKSSSFGAAVAFAACSKRTAASTPKKTDKIALKGGKQMHVPTKVTKGAHGAPRQLASKWKLAR